MSLKKTFCSIIIVTHNSEKHIPKAMKCLEQQTRQADQILFVDTGSRDPSYLDPYKKHNNIEVVIAEKGIGFCRGNNVGWAKISPKTDYVFFLNPDAFITERFLEHAMEFMEQPQNAKCGALTGTTLGYDISLDAPTGKYDTTGVFRKWYGRWYDRAQGEPVNTDLYQEQENVPGVCGAVFFCRKKALDEVILRGSEVFDNTFYMYKEDIELSLRLRSKGWQLIFVPQLVCYHCRGWNTDRKKMPKELRMHSARNELRIQSQSKSGLGMLYSMLKYVMVKNFNV